MRLSWKKCLGTANIAAGESRCCTVILVFALKSAPVLSKPLPVNDLPWACSSTVHWLQEKRQSSCSTVGRRASRGPFQALFRLETPLYLGTCTGQTDWTPPRWESGSKRTDTLEWTAVYEALSTYKPLPGTPEATHNARGAQPARCCSGRSPAQQCPPLPQAQRNKHQTQQPAIPQCYCTYSVHTPISSPPILSMHGFLSILSCCNNTTPPNYSRQASTETAQSSPATTATESVVPSFIICA